jgi:acyl-CoA synthetase (AMP-forming)/AMP-acid ligase II
MILDRRRLLLVAGATGALAGIGLPGIAQAELETLRKFLSTKLPHYLVPGHFTALDQFPLPPNGKIDRQALP